ncbi:MAG: hypothetical protein P8X80_19090 [Desulfobacterales bacterium]
MKAIRQIGSIAFVLGLFTALFIGLPWYVTVSDNPALPWWLRSAVFCLLGGILVVLATLALEQRTYRKSAEARPATESDRRVLLLSSDELPDREITEILGLVQGHTVFAIINVRYMTTSVIGSAAELLVYGTAVRLSEP